MDWSLLSTLLIFVFSLAVLLVSADRFVSGTEEIGTALGVPHFILGITVLAIGTSLPELVTGLIAVTHGSSELVIGTVVGSNIANILLILGLTAIVSRKFTLEWDLLHGDLPILFGSLLLLAFVVYPLSATDLAHFREVTLSAGTPDAPTALGDRAGITFGESVILLLGYILYLNYYAVRNRELRTRDPAPAERSRFRLRSVGWILVGALGIYLGARYTISSTLELAHRLRIGGEVIAASMIAFGTSLPELVVSLSAARRRNFEMAMGNVTGSNIFNTFMVLGIPGLVAPFVGNGLPLRVGLDSVLYLQIPYYGATVLLFLIIVLDKTLTRTEGWMVFLAYLLFMGKLFGLM